MSRNCGMRSSASALLSGAEETIGVFLAMFRSKSRTVVRDFEQPHATFDICHMTINYMVITVLTPN